MTRFCLAFAAVAVAACATPVPDDALVEAPLPDEALAPPMFLSASEAHPGETLTLTATGAAPGATVRFFYSVNGVGPGPRVTGYGTMNFNIRAPVTPFPSGSAVADGRGTAIYQFQLPPTAPDGFTVGVEAAVRLANRSYQTAGSTVVVTARQVCLDDGYEDNDTFGVAGSLNLGAPVLAQLCSGDDDWYAVWLDQGDVATIDVGFSHAEGDVDLYVYGPDGTTAIATSTGVADNERVVFAASTYGWHYLRTTLYADTGALGGNSYNLTANAVPAPVVFYAGQFTVDGSFSGDLDLGQQTGDANGAQADFWHEQINATTRQLTPVGGAAVAAVGFAEPDYADCAAVQKFTTPIDTSDPGYGQLPVGAWFCYTTADGRPGRAQVVSWGPPPSNNLTLAYTTFDSATAWTPANDGVYTILGTYDFDFENPTTNPPATVDIFWNQVDVGTQRLVPRNGALIAAIGLDTPGPLGCTLASFTAGPIDASDPVAGPLAQFRSVCVVTAEGHRAGFTVLSRGGYPTYPLQIGETWWY